MKTLASISGTRKLTDMTEAEAVELITKFSLVKESDLCRVDEGNGKPSIFPKIEAKINDDGLLIELKYLLDYGYDEGADENGICIKPGELRVGDINMDVLGVIEWFLKKGFNLESEAK